MLISNINKKQLAISIAIPLLVGGLASLLNMSGFKEFETMNKPSITPPMVVFPIVWTILYILLGISFYLVFKSDSKFKTRAYFFYTLQLIANFLWTCFFFGAKDYGAAFIVIIILLLSIICMIFSFYAVNKKSAYLQIPYLAWVTFAVYLNYLVYIMNKT